VVSAQVLVDYKELITNTKIDLETHLEIIQERLELLVPASGPVSEDERQKILKEMESTRQCISICGRVSDHIKQIQSESSSQTDSDTTSGASNAAVAERNTPTAADLVLANSLNFCLENLNITKDQLSTGLQKMLRQLDNESAQRIDIESENVSEQDAMEAEAKSIRERLAYFSQASARSEQYRTNVFEDVKTEGDSHQVLVSTVGDLISAKRITGGERTVQLMGQMSDASLQQLSQDGRLPSGRNGPRRQP
jgi:hypothetical protein